MSVQKDGSTNSEFWSQVAKGRDGTHAGVFEPVWTAALDELGVGARTRVLDAGCGSGMATALAVGRGARAYGMDAAATMIELARTRVPEAVFDHCDMESLSFETGFFDGALAINSLHFTTRPLVALRELVRVCTTGGHIAIACLGPREDHNFEAPIKAMLSLVPTNRKSELAFVDPFRLSAVGVLEMMFAEAGLGDVHDRYVECPVVYDNLERACESMRNVALYPAACQVVAPEVLDAALIRSLEPYVESSGRVVWRATHRLVVGRKP